MKLSKTQELASMMQVRSGMSNYYIKNKREKGQPRFFKCVCCGEKFDFDDSVDYIGAVMEWKSRGNKCWACGYGRCHCKQKET